MSLRRYGRSRDPDQREESNLFAGVWALLPRSGRADLVQRLDKSQGVMRVRIFCATTRAMSANVNKFHNFWRLTFAPQFA